MTGRITITVKCEWRWEEGDGSICCCCGDACYLRQASLWLVINNESHQDREYIVCQSCAEAMEINQP